MVEPVVLVHGGAWSVPDIWVNDTIEGVKLAAKAGYNILENGGSALDAVEAAVVCLENDPFFNAGYGSCLNLAGEVVMEASIQRGSDLMAGSVTLIKDIPNPVSLARKVLEDTPHAFLGGDGARDFAIKKGFTLVPPGCLITDAATTELTDILNKTLSTRCDTVGAVVVDSKGRVAAATSTGGTPGKYVGRIGDAPQIGSGTYADDLIGAVSSTGHGESILKCCLAHKIITLMDGGMSALDAARKALAGMTARVDNTAGVIVVSNKGDIGFHFTTKRMSWCYVKANKVHFGIEPQQHEIETYKLI